MATGANEGCAARGHIGSSTRNDPLAVGCQAGVLGVEIGKRHYWRVITMDRCDEGIERSRLVFRDRGIDPRCCCACRHATAGNQDVVGNSSEALLDLGQFLGTAQLGFG